MMRSNYFAVKDGPSFRFFCRRWGLQSIENNQGLHGFYHTESGYFQSHEEMGEYIMGMGNDNTDSGAENGFEDEILISSYVYSTFEEELANLLAYENVAILIEIDHNKMRYLTGSASAINSRHESKRIDLSDIYELAEGLGEFITTAEY